MRGRHTGRKQLRHQHPVLPPHARYESLYCTSAVQARGESATRPVAISPPPPCLTEMRRGGWEDEKIKGPKQRGEGGWEGRLPMSSGLTTPILADRGMASAEVAGLPRESDDELGERDGPRLRCVLC